MGNEISRVYQFISNFGSIENWQKEVDEKYGNGDGTVIKTEFRNFMLNEFGFETGDNENDLINKFWASIDTKTSGKIGATGLSNKNALDADELKRAEEAINATNKISEFVMQQDVPAGISNIENWRNSVKESLLNKALVFLKQNKDAKASDWDINEAFQSTNRQTTADYVAKETIQDKLGEIEGYDADKDKALSRIVDTYVRSLSTDSSTNLNDIVSHVKELVSAYADTAETNSESSIALLGSSYNASGNLNDLQKAVLIRDITSGINKKLENEYKEMFDNYGETISAVLSSYASDKIKNSKASEFSSIKENLDKYVNEFFTDGIKEVKEKYDSFVKARTKLKDYLSDKYGNSKYKESFEAVFGSSEKSAIEDTISKYKTEEEVTKAYDAIKLRIDNILPDDFWNGLEDMTMEQGSTQSFQLASYFGSHSTNDIEYSATGNTDILNVTKAGKVTVNAGAQEGRFEATVSIAVGGQVIGEKKVTITVVKAKGFILKDFSMDESMLNTSSIKDYTDDHDTTSGDSIESAKSNARQEAYKFLQSQTSIKSQVKAELKRQTEATGVEFNSDMEALFEKIYNSSITEALNSDDWITSTRGARGLSSKRHCHWNKQQVVIKFLDVFSRNVNDWINAQNTNQSLAYIQEGKSSTEKAADESLLKADWKDAASGGVTIIGKAAKAVANFFGW